MIMDQGKIIIDSQKESFQRNTSFTVAEEKLFQI